MADKSHSLLELSIATLATLLTLTSLPGCLETDGPAPKGNKLSGCDRSGPTRGAIKAEILAVFPSCCQGIGHLIPEFLVPKEFRSMLAQQGESRCVPDIFATDPDFTPRKCVSVFGLPGACISSCVPAVGNADVPLPAANCDPGDLCAPCKDPRTGEDTGSCKIGKLACENPPEPPGCQDFEPSLDLSQYPVCCQDNSGRAHCAPARLVSDDQKKDLSPCDSGGEAGFCVPDKFLARGGKDTPKTCKSIGGREGRCISVCAPSVAKDMGNLPTTGCDSDERCAPCYDPRTGMGTGACTIGACDDGPKEPPKPFEPCGGGAAGAPGSSGAVDAYCVPVALVPAGDRKNFDNVGCNSKPCSEPGTLCVPKKIIDAGPTYQPKHCENDLLGYLALFQKLFSDPIAAIGALKEYKEGRCLSRCLPQVRPKADLLGQKDCDAGDVCVPCYDPEKAKEGKIPTGACEGR